MLAAPIESTERYHLAQLLGRGGYAEVYLATAESGHTAAFKVLRDKFRDHADIRRHFANEGDLLEQLDHRLVPRIYGRGEIASGRPYLLMEDCGRESLCELVKRRGTLSESEAAWYGIQICEALSYLHRKNLRHGDLKPQNLVIDDCHRIRLIDFGFAVPCDSERDSSGLIHGTPHYLAPEVLHASGQPSNSADVYALGAVLYELLTGSTVFDGRSPLKVCEQQLFEVPVSPSRRTSQAISTNIDTLVLRCLYKDPALRPTVSEISASLSLALTLAPAKLAA